MPVPRLLTENKALSIEIAYPRARHDHAFGLEQRALHPLAAAVSAEASAGGDDPVTGYTGRPAAFHDVADGPRRARRARRRRDVAVRRDAPGRNAADRGEH